jgi:hypothetical protein
VPYTRDTADGLFFIDHNDFYAYFSAYSISYQDDSYYSSTSTVYGDSGKWTRFDFVMNHVGTVNGFLGIDFYTPRMYPRGCKLDSSGNRY